MTEQITINKVACPVCSRPTIYASHVLEHAKDTKGGIWYRCLCGVIFQENHPNPEPKDKKYIDAHYELKEFKYVGHHSAYVYTPIIEELTLGRKMLDVGFGTMANMNYFKQRGWITFGIDNNKHYETTNRILNEDFDKIDTSTSQKYDLVWMSFILEKLKDPIDGLKKAYDLLQPDGCLFIATPDIEFLYSRPSGEWSHWRRNENYLLWSIKALERELERIGFQIIVKRRNMNKRFGYCYNLDIIAQKILF